MEKLGIPYMGSKRKLAEVILNKITNRHEIITDFYDLFGGDFPIIYCDIPYKGTEQYKEGGFDHEKFYQWAMDINHPVYISEYDAPFEKIEMFKHRSSLSATNNKKKVFESILWNGKGTINNYKLF